MTGKPLTKSDVENVKLLIAKNLSVKEIQSITNLSNQTINRIVIGERDYLLETNTVDLSTVSNDDLLTEIKHRLKTQ